MKKAWILLGALTFMAACQTKSGQDPILAEAYQLHLEALDLKKQIQPRLDSLIAVDSMQYAPLGKAFQEWEASLVEVPGFEHAHDHSHGHDHHHHDAPPEVTPEQMKAIQSESIKNLKNLIAQIPQ